jgi:hypothetical protein
MARWKPNYNENYYFVNTITCEVNNYRWKDDEIDRDIYRMGNCFRTKKEAEQAFEKVKELLLSLHGDKDYSNDKESEGEDE